MGNDIPNVKTKDSWYTVGIICQTPPMLSRNHLLALCNTITIWLDTTPNICIHTCIFSLSWTSSDWTGWEMWKYCWWDSWWCTSRTEDLPHYRLMVSSLPSVSSLPLYFCLHAFFLVKNNFAHLFPKGGGATPKYVNSFLKNEGEQAPFFMVLYGLWSYNHTSYLSFFLHKQNFWKIKFTLKFTQ